MASAPSNPVPREFTIDSQRIRYTLAGPPDAPAVILIHGFISHRGVWRQTVAALQARFHCLTLDLLGFGDSDKPQRGDYSIAAQAQRVIHLANGVGFDRFALIGHSMGGQIAFHLAASLAPERVTHVISVAGVVTGRLTPFAEHVAYPQILLGAVNPTLYSLWRELAHQRGFAHAIFRSWFHRMDAIPFEDWATDRAMALQPGMAQSAFQAAKAIRTTDLSAHLASIRAPTLIVFGRDDIAVPLADGHLAAQRIARSRLVLLDACGHFPMYEQPRAYLTALQAFLAESPARTTGVRASSHEN